MTIVLCCDAKQHEATPNPTQFRAGSKQNQWNSEQVDLRLRGGGLGNNRNVFLIGVRGDGFQGDVSLDNVRVREGECCPREYQQAPFRLRRVPGLEVDGRCVVVSCAAPKLDLYKGETCLSFCTFCISI